MCQSVEILRRYAPQNDKMGAPQNDRFVVAPQNKTPHSSKAPAPPQGLLRHGLPGLRHSLPLLPGSLTRGKNKPETAFAQLFSEDADGFFHGSLGRISFLINFLDKNMHFVNLAVLLPGCSKKPSQ